MRKRLVAALLFLLLFPIGSRTQDTASRTFTLTALHNVVLTWTASPTPGLAGYDVYRGTTSGGESSTPLNSSPIATGCPTTVACQYIDLNVVAGTKYYYVITAVASNGITQSADSNEASATVPTP
jgi:hypothetical protein